MIIGSAPPLFVCFCSHPANIYISSQAACIAKLKDETEGHPELQDFENPNYTPADGRSTGAVSSVGTPMATGVGGGGPKLKLTFNGNRDGYMNGGDSGMQSDND